MKITFNLLVLVTLLALAFGAAGVTRVDAAAMDFQILSLTASNPTLYLNHGGLTGDDRGGIALSTSKVFYSGDSATGSWNLADLSGATSVGALYDGLTSNLNTGDVYTLGTASGPISAAAPDTVTRLLAINGATGALTGAEITLSSPISINTPDWTSEVGIFAGYDRVLIHNSTDVYEIALPSGVVTHLGSLAMPTHRYCESWAYWGVAEHFGGNDYIAYVQDINTIARMRVSDGAVSTIASFTSLNDMCSFTVSPGNNRWYFHHEYDSQFATGVNELLGYADATFSLGSSDTTPPVVTVPSDITEEATSSAGAVVNFVTSATDETSPANPAVSCSPASGSTFPLGTTPVTCQATDDASNTGYGYFNVTVVDTTPPVVTVPSDITEEATSSSGAVVNFSTSATDTVSPANPSVSCDWPSGSTFPLGTTPVTCQATDDASNTGYGYFNVIVQDTTAPVTSFDSTPASLTNSTSATFTFHATDAVSASANINSYCYLDDGAVLAWALCTSPLNLSGLSEGYHVLWIYANDEAGNTNYNTSDMKAYGWTVDLTAPGLGLVADNPYEATGPGGANAGYTASYTDTNGVASQSCSPASGSLFPIGSTQVDCTATDNAGNVSNNSFNIVVVDTTDPTLNLPANITVPQVIPAGAVVNFIVTANDIVDASPTVSCTPASGSTFPVGTTTVNCSATDDYSNTSNGSFTVTVTAASGGNLLKKPDFASASVFPSPWQAFGFKPPYAAALDCNFFNFGSCSVLFPAGNRSAMQRVVRSGVAGDMYSFGMYSAANNAPSGGKYLVEVAFYNNYNRLVGISQLNFSLGTHGFELVNGPAVATGNYNKITFRFYYQNPSGRAWFDDAFLYFVSAP